MSLSSTCGATEVNMQLIICSDRSSYSDDMLVYIQLGKATFWDFEHSCLSMKFFLFIGSQEFIQSLHHVHWSISPLVYCSIVPLVHWSIDPLVHWLNVKYQMPNVNKVNLLLERTSGVPPVIFESPVALNATPSTCNRYLPTWLLHKLTYPSHISWVFCAYHNARDHRHHIDRYTTFN